MATETPIMSRQDADLALQDRFVRGFAWLRKVAGMTQSAVAAAAGWKQPYVARLEDAQSPLLGGLARVERYADACGFTTVLVFVDKNTGAVERTLNLGEAGKEAAGHLLPPPAEAMDANAVRHALPTLRLTAAQAAAARLRYERS
jgi:transcriptional regulator with XRE-family HTH domain